MAFSCIMPHKLCWMPEAVSHVVGSFLERLNECTELPFNATPLNLNGEAYRNEPSS